MMVFLNGSRLEFNYSKQKPAVFNPDTNILCSEIVNSYNLFSADTELWASRFD